MSKCMLAYLSIIFLHTTIVVGMCIIEEFPELALQMIANEQYHLRMRKAHSLAGQVRVKGIVGQAADEIKNDSDECPLCLEDYSRERKCVKLLCDTQRNISHQFCQICLTAWQQKENNCPTCRREIIEEEPSVCARLVNLSRIAQLFSCSGGTFEERE